MESSDTLRELIERARRGEAAAVVVIVRRFREHALELARALVGDGHLAEDAVQQAFMRAMASLGSLRDAGAFAGWLRQIVRTECDHIRRQKMLPSRSAGAGGGEEGVAGILQVPEGTVKRRLYDARELLRQELRGLMGEIDD